MFKKTITYTDYNDVERTETFYFNLNKAEVIEMETEEEGGYGEMLKRVVESKDPKVIMKVFKNLILKSYGIKSEDGKGFAKSEEISKEFENSAAFGEIFMELCTNAESASEFISRIMPMTNEQRKEVMEQAKTTSLTSGS